MIDTVTIAFADELDVLRLQARSIDLYCQEIGINNIIVVVNDDPELVQQIDTAWWGSLSSRVKIVHKSHWSEHWAENGWLTQQLLKLRAAESSTNIWSMILDAKTIFVQTLKIERIFDQQGRLRTGLHTVSPVFEPSARLVSQLFDINLTQVAGPSGVPFFFNNQLIKQMIPVIEQQTGQEFNSWFQEQGMITEFILYTGYVQSQHDLNTVYAPGDFYKICNICHSELARANDKLTDMQDPDTLTVSVHRRAWAQFTAEQQLKYLSLLESKGVV